MAAIRRGFWRRLLLPILAWAAVLLLAPGAIPSPLQLMAGAGIGWGAAHWSVRYREARWRALLAELTRSGFLLA